MEEGAGVEGRGGSMEVGDGGMSEEKTSSA